ncbi:MAG: TonB family protein, partial [Myxococcales bacterium]|nr:TonB family protein [Myxococcales bacterium]
QEPTRVPGEATSASQEPTRSVPGPVVPGPQAPGPLSERTVDSGEFTDLLFAVRPPEAEPRRRPPARGALTLPPDGFEPSIWADPEPPRPPAVEHLDAILGDLTSGRPTGDRQGGVVVEVARIVDGVVAASQVLHSRDRFPRGQPVVRHTGQGVVLCIPAGATGRRMHLGASETVPEGPSEMPLEPGDRAELRWAQATWRIRVDHAARDAGRATGRRKPWGVYLGALGAGAVLHLLFALGVVSLDAVGVQLTVAKPPPKERFASLKDARELPKIKPKPKPKAPPPKPPKPRPERAPKAKEAPAPRPSDPAEATPQLPSSVRQKVRRKMQRARQQAQGDAEALLSAVNAGADAAPTGDDVTLKDVASNIDAVGKAGATGAALEVPGVGAPLPGGDVNIGRDQAPLATTGGQQIGARVGRLGEKTTKGAGRIRGKVRNLSSRTKVSSCSLSKGQVRTAVDQHQGKVVGCYERALLKSAALSGKLTVEWRITPQGEVRSAKVKSSTLGDAAVAECVLGVIRSTRFPAPPDGGECVIAYPFIFSPSQ